jgi:hypothetical protein
MTIKQQGGVFGRNPTFNTVTANSLNVNGTIISDGANLDGAVVINDSGADVDFRVESDTIMNALFVEGSSGRVGVGTTSPSQALDVVGSIEVSVGIYLGGTTSANLLDDYEEGTFTPELADATSGGNIASGTFTAHYTKIGRVCHCFISFLDIDTTGMTAGNVLSFRGLPFLSGPTERSAGSAVRCDNINFGNYVMAEIAAGTNVGAFNDIVDNSADLQLLVSSITASGTSDMFFNFTYFTA